MLESYTKLCEKVQNDAWKFTYPLMLCIPEY